MSLRVFIQLYPVKAGVWYGLGCIRRGTCRAVYRHTDTLTKFNILLKNSSVYEDTFYERVF